MTLAKVKKQDGMMLAKVKEQDGMMLAKVKEQDGMMLAKSKGTRWDDTCKSEGTRWNNACKCKSPNYPYISGLLRRCAIDKCEILFLYLLQPLSDRVLQNTYTSSYLQLSTTSSDCVLQTQIPLVIYNCQLLHRTASSKHRYL